MKTRSAEADLAARAAFFKALGHPARLLILNLIRMKPRHGEELAEILSLNPATISHHLSKLADVGLVTAHKDQYYQMYSLQGDWLEKRLSDLVTMRQAELPADVSVDAYRKKVIDTFFKFGRLTQFPSQMKKRFIVLEYIVQEFEPEREYTEPEVNQVLVEFNEDVASLRRGMIEAGLMNRKDGCYWRTN
jgi:biotin operon repressor